MCESDQRWYLAHPMVNPLKRYRLCLANSEYHALEKLGVSAEGWRIHPVTRRALAELFNGNGAARDHEESEDDDPIMVVTQDRLILIHG